MIGIVGIVIIFVMVFGGFMLAGGKMGIILKAVPFEMIMIGGAAAGAFFISNNMATVKATMRDMGKVFKGPTWKPQDYRDLLCLLFELIRLAKANPVAVEEHVENPEDSSIFGKYPKILHDHETIELICDTQSSASAITIAAYDDDYLTSTVLGTVDMANARPRLTRCGSAYRRAWLLSHSANTGFRIEALAGRSSEGTS